MLCMEPLIYDVIMMGGRTYQHSWADSAWRASYFSSFLYVVICGNLSLQHVNLKICTFRFGFRCQWVVWIWVICVVHNL